MHKTCKEAWGGEASQSLRVLQFDTQLMEGAAVVNKTLVRPKEWNGRKPKTGEVEKKKRKQLFTSHLQVD